MTKNLFLTCFAGILALSSFSQEKTIKKYSEILSPEALKKQLSVIAGPEMEGRETATEGQRKAAAYIESQMKAIGLQPGYGTNYQQEYLVYQDSLLASSMSINGKELEWKKDFTARSDNFNQALGFSDIVFISMEDSIWKKDSFNLNGKLVMVKQPTATIRERFAMQRQLVNLQKKGVATIILIDTKDTLSIASPIGSMRINKFPASHTSTIYTVTPAIATHITGTNRLDTLHTNTYSCNVELSTTTSLVTKSSTNVIGILPGNGKSDEWLLLTAHYDHLGKKDSVIWYGADDDGSGTAMVLELARTFAKASADGHGSDRNIMFMTVSGEEKGLLGSKFFTENPTIPLEKVTADLNIDMVGRTDTIYEKRTDKNYLYVVGSDKLSSELTSISKEANKKLNLVLDLRFDDPKDRERIYYRSDHYNFAKHGIPVMFYYDGGNPDYHRPTDTVEKIDFELMSLRAKYIFTSAWIIAHRPLMLKRDLDRAAVGVR